MPYVTLRRLSLADAPASGQEIVIFDSTINPPGRWRGLSSKLLIFNLFTSHASAASGYIVDESNDGGASWDNLNSYSINAGIYTKTITKVSALDIRVRYQNSPSNLTVFRGALLADESERGNG